MQRMEALRGPCCDDRRATTRGRSGDRPGRRNCALEPGKGALQLAGLARPLCEPRAARRCQVTVEEALAMRHQGPPGLLCCNHGGAQTSRLARELRAERGGRRNAVLDGPGGLLGTAQGATEHALSEVLRAPRAASGLNKGGRGAQRTLALCLEGARKRMALLEVLRPKSPSVVDGAMTAGLPLLRREEGLPMLFMNFEDMLALRLRLRQRATSRSGAETKRAAVWPQVPPEESHHE
eukprot:11365856-Alexandrium_andersonii.AAC.1